MANQINSVAVFNGAALRSCIRALYLNAKIDKQKYIMQTLYYNMDRQECAVRAYERWPDI